MRQPALPKHNRIAADIDALPFEELPNYIARLGLQRATSNVLVIEDDTDMNQLVSSTLRADGLHVDTAHDGEEGIRAALERQPDLIVLDLLLPKIDGFGILELLFSMPSTRGIPVLVLTGVSRSKAEVTARSWSNVMRFVTKPIETRELSRTVNEILNRPGRS